MTPATTPSPDWFMVCMGLFGGLALFLFGLDQLSEGLKQATGDRLKTLLTRLTSNRFLGVLTGAVVTGILNSSSVTTVLVVSFVTAGVMTLAQSVAVIMGANIGSTVTAQLLAFNLTAYALLPVALGFFMLFAAKRKAMRHWGAMLMGLGLVFYGMGVMGDAMKPLRTYAPFVNALAGMSRPLLGVLTGAIFTALIQSSAATMGIAIALASEGLLSLPAGIALALGANIGTCATALLAAIGKPVEAVRAAAVHVAFNVLGVLLWLPFIGLLGTLAIAVSPACSELEGAARMAAEVPRQIANANTLFNVLNTLIFIGFTGWFARLTTRLVPDRPDERAAVKPHYIDPATLSVPAVALEQARQETARMGDAVQTMLRTVADATSARNIVALRAVTSQHGNVLTLGGTILEFLARVHQETITASESETHARLMTIVVHLDAVADLIAGDLADVLGVFFARPEPVQQIQRGMAGDLLLAVQQAFGSTIAAVRTQDHAATQQIVKMSEHVRTLADNLRSQLLSDWQPTTKDSIEELRLRTSFVDSVCQIFTLTKRIARAV